MPIEGTFRLKYSLYEMKQGKTIYRTCAISEPFTVFSYKNFPGYKESSALAKYFAEQGVKIKIKKDVNVPRVRYSKYTNDIWLNDGGKILSREEMMFKEKLSEIVKQKGSLDVSIEKSKLYIYILYLYFILYLYNIYIYIYIFFFFLK